MLFESFLFDSTAGFTLLDVRGVCLGLGSDCGEPFAGSAAALPKVLWRRLRT